MSEVELRDFLSRDLNICLICSANPVLHFGARTFESLSSFHSFTMVSLRRSSIQLELSAVSKFNVIACLTEETKKFIERLLKPQNVLIQFGSKNLLLLAMKVVALLLQGKQDCDEG